MRILIIEDELKTASHLKKGLSEHGYVVDAVARGDDGLHLSITEPYELVILDVMLPELDGWAVLSELRKRGKSTPVLFLTAKDAVRDRIKGLELGADDYLVKPFAFDELLARIRSVLRRGPVRQPDTLTIRDLEIDLVGMKAKRNGQLLDLTAKEFTLLALFARRPGEVISRSVIASQVWDMNFDSDSNVIDVHIRRLRAKVDDPFHFKLIRTVRGMGYVLEADS